MKKIITATLATLIAGQVMASNYTCEEQYEAKIKKVEASMGNAVIPATQLLSGWAVPVGLSVVGVGLIVTAPLFLAAGASMFARDKWLENKYSHLLFAETVIFEAVIGKEVILKEAKEKHEKKQIEYARRIVREINVRRAELGMPDISLEDYLSVHPIEAFNPSTIIFATDRLVSNMNMKEPGKYTFESVSAIIKELSDGDTFCPEGKPRGIKQLTKIIKDNI